MVQQRERIGFEARDTLGHNGIHWDLFTVLSLIPFFGSYSQLASVLERDRGFSPRDQR